MRVENVTLPSHQILSEQRSQAPSAPFLSSWIQMDEHGAVKKGSPLLALLEDMAGFFRNLFLFPFLGHQILFYQLLFALFIPILLPYLIFTEIVYALLNLCTYGCIKHMITPKFDLTPPTSAERAILARLVETYGNRNIYEGHQIRLAHIMSRYVDYVARYANNEDYGSRYALFQSLIKIDVDGTSKLFQFCPSDDKQKILQEYLEFVGVNMTPKSDIKHQFIGLDYQYVLGLLKMELKTDIIDYDCQHEVEETMGICGSLFGFFAPAIGKHIQKDSDNLEHFALWPRFTRNAICERINRQLASHDLEGSQISLIDLEHLVRG